MSWRAGSVAAAIVVAVSATSVGAQTSDPVLQVRARAHAAAIAPTVLILPTDTVYDPDAAARGRIANGHFASARIPHLLIVNPPGFVGHYAAFLPVFDFAYGRCIAAFLERPATLPCPTPALANDDFRSILALNQLAGADTKRISAVAPLVGKRFVTYSLGPDNRRFDYVATDRRTVMETTRQSSETIAFRNGMQCAGEACSVLERWSERELLEFDPTSGRLAAWWIEDR